MGDVAGVGPEIILKVIKDYPEAIVYGSFDVLSYYNTKYEYNFDVVKINSPEEYDESKVNVIDPLPISMNEFEVGVVSPECGKRSCLYCEKAISDAMDKKIGAVITCPLNKEALHLGGYNYDGHTEIFAKLTDTKEYGMLLWSDKLKTIHNTTHCSLKTAIERCKKDRIISKTLLAYNTLKQAGYEDPRIAIAGLNPHAGENGLFGDEEIKEIIPAVEELKKMGLNIDGPVAPDTVFLKCYKGQYDVVVAMYHDQGHIPLKMMDFDGGVNMTVGLPIIRTSVDHGTAFDIAGKNIANKKSLIEAIEAAKRLM